MNRHPADRLIAWLVDWLYIVAWVIFVAAIGVPLLLTGVTREVNATLVNVIGAAVLIVPVTIGAAWRESSAQGATPGKRRRRLHVIAADTGARVPFRRALLRNTVKIALPWALGHVVVVTLVQAGSTRSVPAWVWIVAVAAYALPAIYVASLFIRRGRTPYDRMSRTDVVSTETHDAKTAP